MATCSVHVIVWFGSVTFVSFFFPAGRNLKNPQKIISESVVTSTAMYSLFIYLHWNCFIRSQYNGKFEVISILSACFGCEFIILVIYVGCKLNSLHKWHPRWELISDVINCGRLTDINLHTPKPRQQKVYRK